ncbi:MAG: PAS domain S-box protein [Desulfobacterales bacterium]
MLQYSRYIFFIFMLRAFPPAAAAAGSGPAVSAGDPILFAAVAPAIPAAAALALLLLVSIAINLLQHRKARRLRAETAQQRENTRDAVRRQKNMAEIFNNLHEYIFVHDMQGQITEFNTPIQRGSDYTEKELKQMNIRDLVPEPFQSHVADYLERVRENGKDSGYLRIQNKSGEEIILEYDSTLLFDNDGRPRGVRGIARDVTRELRAWKSLEKSEKKYRNILETIEDGYYEVDLAGHYQFLNRSVLRMLGYDWEELRGASYKKLIAEDDVPQVYETFNYVYRTGKPVKSFHWRAIRKDGAVCFVETSVSLSLDDHGNAAGFQGIVRDISERIEARNRQKELESQLQQAQKMESIGTLAGGIAHDFNNILFPIIGYTELAMQDLPNESQACRNLEEVLKSAQRAKGLVQQILNFSRQSANEPAEPVHLQPVIKETVKLLRNTIPASIDIRADIDEDIEKVRINVAQMHQVIMNLCTNAYQALENMETGEIRVSVTQVTVSEQTSPQYQNLTPGPYVCIAVSDTGAGIAPEVQEKIFEPYYTTKPQEKGTGLGLSVSYGIVRNVGGTITVESTPGKGSHFRVYLPVTGESAEIFQPGGYPGAMPQGTERILLVDDEQQIVELTKQMLESLAYHVTPRTSSIEALEAFRHQPEKFDLLLTDQAMPNKNGTELIKAVHEIRPDLPVILCTGYSERVSREKTETLQIDALLLKPLSKNDLAVTLDRVLHKSMQSGTKNASSGDFNPAKDITI